MPKPDGGPAFPVEREEPSPFGCGQSVLATYSGMSLRDYFAGQMLPELMHQFCQPESAWEDYGELARTAYTVADAMLAERAR